MTKPTTSPQLNVLDALSAISAEITASGAPLTATRLKRTLNMSDNLFDEAVTYGCTEKYLKWGDRNYYSVMRNFTVPEEAYYQTVMNSIDVMWREEGFDKNNFYIENTSRRDSKIEGPWTRPDLTLGSIKKFPWTIGSEFDVVTFEIKRPDSANVLAVFEALSHATAATRAYVVFPVDAETWRQINPAQERRVKDECIRHGVGLVLVSSVSTNPIAHHILKAYRREIDHEKCSAFLDAVLSDNGKRKISEWKS